MKRKPKKPTGLTGVTKISAGPDGGSVTFQPMVWPTAKRAVEELVAAAFMREANAQAFLPYAIEAWRQSPEDDFDFLLETSAGPRYLELMEIAPLENMPEAYASLPVSNSPYDLARWTMDRALAKSARYGSRGAGKLLVLYTTHWTLATSITARDLLQYWFATSPHNFERVNLCHPVTDDSSIVESVFPTHRSNWCGFDPEKLRTVTTHNLPPWGWKSRGD